MPYVTAGERRHRVSIQTRTEASDGHDGLVEEWTTVRSRWSARVRPLQGRDLERARQVDPRISHDVTFAYWRDYRADLAGGRAQLLYHPTSRAADDRTLEIVSPPIDTNEAHREVIVLCREAA